MRRITISRDETKHQVAEQYATVFDNGLVEIRRNVRTKLTSNESDTPENRLTIEQLQELVRQLEEVPAPE